MTTYYSTSDFRKCIKSLNKKPKEGYTAIIDEICSDFQSKTIDEIRQNKDLVYSGENFNIIKLRLPDKARRISKKDGYRVFYLVYTNKDEVVFLYVYPKRGPQNKITLSANEIMALLKTYVKEKEEDILVEHDINGKLKVI